jgi:hypothetical protein
MTRPLLRFLISLADQQRIASITVDDGPPTAPGSLRLRFAVTNTAPGPIAIRPPFPASMWFVPDPSAPGSSPAPTDAFTWDAAQYAGWRTIGTVAFQLLPTFAKKIQDLTGAPAPTWAWFWPVQIPQGFLFDAFRKVLPKSDVLLSGPPKQVIKKNNSAWDRYAVSGFLTGMHPIPLRTHPTDPAQDDAVQPNVSMPTIAPGGQAEVWMALTTGGAPADQDEATITVAAGGIPVLNPSHPRYGPLGTRELMRRVRPVLLEAAPGAALADVALADWPVGPRYFTVRYSAPGRPEPFLTTGVLTGQRVRATIGGGGVLWDQRIPIHGLVTIAQASPGAGPVPSPPVVDFVRTSGDLRVAETSPNCTLLAGSGSVRVDFSTAGTGVSRIVLQPAQPVSGGTAARAAYAHRLAELVHPVAGSPNQKPPHPLTAELVKASRKAHEDRIRPAPGVQLFFGRERPWAGVSLEDLTGLFAGLQRLSFTGLGPPNIRPAEAMVVWIMEGKIAGREAGMLVDQAQRKWRSVTTDCRGFHTFSVAAVNGSPDSAIRTLLRVMLVWSLWGLDIMNDHSVVSADNKPQLSGASLATAATVMDNFMHNRSLTAIATAGISAPSVANVNATLELRKRAGEWEWRIGVDHLEIMLWLQQAEYLRRASRLPPEVTQLPTYRYLAFNGGFEKDPNEPNDWNAAAGTWNLDQTKVFWRRYNDAQQRVANGQAADMDEGLRWQASPAEVAAVGADSLSVARINALLFAALVGGYGSLFPRAV